jgi:hypothetical protein
MVFVGHVEKGNCEDLQVMDCDFDVGSGDEYGQRNLRSR